jgi:Zn-finger protein
LYALGDKCGGNFRYTEGGIKDCSGCLIPHKRGNYGLMMEKMNALIELAKKP